MTGASGRRTTRSAQVPAARAADSGAEGDLRALFGQSMAVFASLAGPAHMLEAANPAFFAAIGGPERTRTGVPLGQLMPELTAQGFIGLLDRVYRTGEAHVGRNARVMLGEGRRRARRSSTSPTSPAWTPAATSWAYG